MIKYVIYKGVWKMSLSESVLMWIVSFLIFLGILFFSYKISYKLGIKKALYRTTYILISIIFAFAITPVVTNQFFNMDLTKFDIVLRYKDKSFVTIIDYLEEVVVHSEFLNSLYAYFPSLKELFMDFPQLLFAPIVYVLLFVFFMILWLPLYLYLSYKRKRRILYDREDNKAHRVWAGILGVVQTIFLFSIVLSPINGINRMYQNSIRNTLDEEYDSLCDGNEFLKEYEKYCQILEIYDSTVFATLGGNKSLSNYTFDSLTRITYNGGYTTLAKETSLIVKSGIVLNQSGLIDVMSQGVETIPIPLLVSENFEEEDIDIIVDTLSNSKYSEDLLVEIEDLAYNTFNDLVNEVIMGEKITLDISMTREEAIEEIKVVLKVLPMLVSTTLISDIETVKAKIENFVYNVPDNRVDDMVVISFLVDLFESVNLDEIEILCEYLLESKIVNNVLPYILNSAFGDIGFNFLVGNVDVLEQVYNFLDLARLFKKYKPIGFFEFILELNDEELALVGDIINYLCSSDDSVDVIRNLFSTVFVEFDYVPITDILNVTDWSKEMYVLRDICEIVRGIVREEEVNVDLIWKVWKNDNSEIAAIGRKIVKSNTNYITQEIIESLGG